MHLFTRRGLALAAAAATAAVGLAACGGGGDNGSSKGASGTPIKGGTVTVAEQPGAKPNYIFPVTPVNNYSVYNTGMFQNLMWRPLFYMPKGTSPVIDYSRSSATKPVYSKKNTVLTFKANPKLKWSNGKPLTARDFVFAYNIYVAAFKENPGNVPNYSKGDFPDDVKSFKAIDKDTVQVKLDGPVNQAWFNTNEISLLYALPQAAWDKKSDDGKVGDYDTTPAGAKKVYDYLAKEAKDIKHYGSNPLWQVVDGPWKLGGYDTSGKVTFVPNPSYNGPHKPKLAKVVELPFTSEDAQFNQVKANKIDVGYIPSPDLPQVPQVKRKGYTVIAKPAYSINYIVPNFKNPKTGPIFKQLYFRQAVQMLINQPAIIKAVYHGYALPAYGPVPVGNNPWASNIDKNGVYPYNVDKAKQLLQSHGWKITPNGVDTCQSPGTGANQCGAGIKKGAKLSFGYDYSSESKPISAISTTLKSDASKVGIQLKMHGKQFNDIIAQDNNEGSGCDKSKCYTKWDIQNYGGISFTGYPSGGVLFKTGGSLNSGSYSDPQVDKLVPPTQHSTSSDSTGLIQKYSDYISKQVPTWWEPLNKRVYVFQKKLGAKSQDALGGITQYSLTPGDWYLTK